MYKVVVAPILNTLARYLESFVSCTHARGSKYLNNRSLNFLHAKGFQNPIVSTRISTWYMETQSRIVMDACQSQSQKPWHLQHYVQLSFQVQSSRKRTIAACYWFMSITPSMYAINYKYKWIQPALWVTCIVSIAIYCVLIEIGPSVS